MNDVNMESDEVEEIPTHVLSKLYYAMIAFQVVAALVSVVVMMGLLIPLLIQLKDGSFYRKRRSRRSGKEPPYSTYNLYITYVAFVDLLYLLVEVIAECTVVDTESNVFVPRLAKISNVPYSHANLLINTIIVYEVLLLLRASKNGRRIEQPSLKRVNLQAGGIIIGSILFYILIINSFWNGWISSKAYISIIFSIYILPNFYVFAVAILVKCKAYLPKANGATPRGKAVRGLALFFLRIILVFGVIWLPSVVLAFLSLSDGVNNFETNRSQFFTILGQIFLALQPILTFTMLLTKPDVKQYIIDFVTLNYSQCRRSTNAGKTENSESNASSILGFTFEGVSEDIQAAEEEDVETKEIEISDMENGTK